MCFIETSLTDALEKKKEAWGFPGQITLGTYMLYSPLGDSQCLAYHVNNSEKFSREKKKNSGKKPV